MVDESIKSLRSLSYASLVILLIWLVAWPNAQQRLALYPAAVDLHKWLYLRAALEKLEYDDFEKSAPDHTISNFTALIETGAPNHGQLVPDPRPLEILETWPDPRSYRISLLPDKDLNMPENEAKADIIRMYKVISDPTNPYLADYRVIWQKSGEIAVVPKRTLFQREQPLSIRQVERIMIDDNRPERWDELALILAKHSTGSSVCK